MPQRNISYEQVPVGDLSKTAQRELPQIDKHVREISDLRAQLAGLTHYCRHYIKKTDGDTKLNLRQICEKTREGDGYLTDYINYPAISKEVQMLEIQDETTREVHERVLIHAVETAFAMGQDVYDKLTMLHGDWTMDNKQSRKIERHYRAVQIAATLASEVFDALEHREAVLRLQASQIPGIDVPAIVKTELLQSYVWELTNLREERTKLVTSSPEAYITYHTRSLKLMKETFDNNGRIVETASVRDKISHVLRIVGSGPVFIHGELGTGKTEFARYVCERYLSAQYLERWEAVHPRPDSITSITGDTNEHFRLIESQKAAWESARREAAQPYILSGHKFAETTDFTARLGIKIDKTLTPEEKVKKVIAQWEIFVESNNIQPEDSESWKSMFVEAYTQFLNTPVETVALLGPLYKAMKEGRPLIIDEINAIPHHVLIGLNDLLLRKPGDTVTPLLSEAEPFKVKAGFCVLATGNYRPEDGRVYIGRQPMDPAFLSRFGILSYDYLPQNNSFEIAGSSNDELREFRARNELQLMLVTRMMDPDLTLTLPKGAFDRLTALSVAAARIQEVFSGKHDRANQAWNARTSRGDIDPQDVLKENVLSIRHMLRIVDLWKTEAYTRSLDYYLYTEYIDRSTRPEEKAYLYKIMQVVAGFFPTDEGWPKENTTELRAFNLHSHPTLSVPMTTELTRYGRSELIERLFGPIPERQTILRKKPEREEVSNSEIAARAANISALIRDIANNGTDPRLRDFAQREV